MVEREIWDLVTVGGGAAGFFGSITHAWESGGSTLILERTAQVLGKVKISGGGRCNVTHDLPDVRAFCAHYPRGEKTLIGPLHRWGSEDTQRWFEERGVTLKTEDDGRIFPVSNSSESIIRCLTQEARKAGVEVRTRAAARTIERAPREGGGMFRLILENGQTLRGRRVLLATGGTRLAASARLAEQLGHRLAPAVPSLFTLRIRNRLLEGLQGLSSAHVICEIVGSDLRAAGPLLITHWGLSGPAILRLSAWGSRQLAEAGYRFLILVNWLPGIDVAKRFNECRQAWGRRQLGSKSPFDELPKRLWERFLEMAEMDSSQVWSHLSRRESDRLEKSLTRSTFQVEGKSLNKDEFVTCGGVLLRDIDMRTMESRLCPGLYFAGEVIDVDGLTGGFNFQNAWTTGYHAGVTIAEASGRKCGSPPKPWRDSAMLVTS